MNKSTSIGLLILRACAGLFMLVGHGWSKLMSYSDKSEGFPDPLGLGNDVSLMATIGAEVVCAFLVTIGLGTRFVALALAFTMGVALFVIHGDDPWNKKELAALFLACYATLIFTGGGEFSVDGYLGKRRAAKKGGGDE